MEAEVTTKPYCCMCKHIHIFMMFHLQNSSFMLTLYVKYALFLVFPKICRCINAEVKTSEKCIIVGLEINIITLAVHAWNLESMGGAKVKKKI